MRTLRPMVAHWRTIVPLGGGDGPSIRKVRPNETAKKGVCSYVRVQCGLLGDPHKFKIP